MACQVSRTSDTKQIGKSQTRRITSDKGQRPKCAIECYASFPPPLLGKVTIFLQCELLELTRHYARAEKFKVVHGLDTTEFEVSNGDQITLNSRGKWTSVT